MRKSKARVSAWFWIVALFCFASSILAVPLSAETTDDMAGPRNTGGNGTGCTIFQS